MIPLALSSSNRLHLTKDEADRLAEITRQKLVCRTATQANGPVVVADIFLTTAEGWRLIDRLESLTVEEIDWAIEGF